MNSSRKLLIDSCRVCDWFLKFKSGEPIKDPLFSYVTNCFDGYLLNNHKMSDLLFTQAGIRLTEVNRVNGICHGIVTDVFETELFSQRRRLINLNNPPKFTY